MFLPHDFRAASVILAMIVLCSVFSPVHAEIPQVISYQGKVTDTSGNPVADGSYTMRFRVYDAATAGTVLWDSGSQTIGLSAGVFNVLLGESPQPALALSFDIDYWLLVTFEGVNQTPRQRLASSGYAYMASGLVPGTEVSGAVTTGTLAAVKGTNTVTSGYVYGLYGESASGNGTGVYGKVTATSGSSDGVRGESASIHGMGVFGRALATTGTTYGVIGQTYSTAGRGVSGTAVGTSGITYGVYGTSQSTAGYGVRGDAPTAGVYGYGSSSAGWGVYGISAGTTGARGVYGNASASAGTTYGVYGRSTSTDGTGVCGEATASTGITTGVIGYDSSTSGRGVFGEASASTGTTYGGKFEAASTSGIAVFGEASATTGTTYGVRAFSYSPAGTGVYGYASAYGGRFESASPGGIGVYGGASATSGTVYGGYFESNSSYGRGVYALASTTSGTAYGGYFESNSTDGRGVYGLASATSGTTYGGRFETTSASGIGVYGRGGSSGWAADFQGNVRIRSFATGTTVMELGEGLDYAEGFDVSEHRQMGPGTVLIIDPHQPGKLTISRSPYDSRVAGIVAGAKGLDSGVRLGVDRFDYNVALAGRVYCNTDATENGIEPGDLLTTSATPGFAMKAVDSIQANGAILGKAMERLERGQKGQILVLVTLQ